MTLNNLRCAVIGLGRIGWNFHIPQLMKYEGFTLSAIVDPNESRLQDAREKLGISALFKNCSEIADGSIDLAVISSPTPFHCEQALYFLRHGVDVFCDKPMAMSYAEAKTMARTAAELGRKLMVYQPHRLSTTALTAKSILASGKLGRIFKISRSADGFTRRNDWQALSRFGGGMLFNYGAHFIDQLFYLGNDSCGRAKCELRKVLSLGDAEDVVSALITGKSGILYELSINQANAFTQPDLAIFGNMGSAMEMPDGNWKLRYCTSMPALTLESGLAAKDRKYPSEELPWQEEIVKAIPEHYGDFYIKVREYFAEGREPFIPIEETLEVMRTIELCQESARGN
ncbi:MAG: Gfo/Idh/MocA family oxidoreductase [Victivallales bacterium]|nr:Gfo/Idh/MocA family oxidoreductase [Victivallales bacterium]